MAVARYKAEPRSKQQGMTSMPSRLVMFTSEHVSIGVFVSVLPTDLDTYVTSTAISTDVRPARSLLPGRRYLCRRRRNAETD